MRHIDIARCEQPLGLSRRSAHCSSNSRDTRLGGRWGIEIPLHTNWTKTTDPGTGQFSPIARPTCRARLPSLPLPHPPPHSALSLEFPRWLSDRLPSAPSSGQPSNAAPPPWPSPPPLSPASPTTPAMPTRSVVYRRSVAKVPRPG